jgi:uncharacterized tellurite resistance protein B-like protein
MPLGALLPLITAILEPQAGGGGSFGGGGGSGGGGGGGGDGIGYLIYWLIRLAIEVPLVGVPLLIVVIVLFIQGSRRGWWKHQERTIRRSRPGRRANASRASAAVLRERDSEFDEARFLARVSVAFGKAQKSWCEQDLEPLRPFVSDGVFERFSLQIEEQIEDGWRQEMKGLSTESLGIVHVESGTHFDTITVRIPFRADIHRLDRASGKKISGSTLKKNRFVECWSFVRRRGAKTSPGDGLIEGVCPNCGAPLSINQSARCDSCECLARSGEYDWVLTEITQESEWSTESESTIPGLAAYLERDPGMSVQLLEDRASVAFWRKCAADRAGRVDPLRRIADEAFCTGYGDSLARRGNGYSADCAVGSVRTLGLLTTSGGDRDRDRAVVEVVWDGRTARIDGESRRSLSSRRRLRRTLFVLARPSGSRTRLNDTFTTVHCRSCGAHDLGGTDPRCPYCETPRTGDASSWLVSEILDAGSQEAREVRVELEALKREASPRVRVESSAGGLLAWAATLVRQDGRIDDRERKALSSLAEHRGLDAEQLEALLHPAADDRAPASPRDFDEACTWVEGLVDLALADGVLQSAEKRFLRHAAGTLGLTPRELEQTIRERRTALYAESRAARSLG